VLSEAGGAVDLPAAGPGILFCLSGGVDAENGVGALALKAGEALFIPAGRAVTATGDGTFFHTTTA